MRFLLIPILFITLTSCKRKCDGFDSSLPMISWYPFPQNENQIIFKTDSLSDTVSLVNLEVTEPYEQTCLMCYCSAEYFSQYISTNTDFNSAIRYSEGSLENAVINFSINESKFLLESNESNQIIPFANRGIYDSIQVTHIEEIIIKNQSYFNIIEIEVFDSEVENVWIQQSNGLIAYKENGMIWVKQ